MTEILIGAGLGVAGLIWGLIAQIRVGRIKADRFRVLRTLDKAEDERDDYRKGLHDLKSELQKSGLTAARDIHVLKARIDECREVFNALPESDITRELVNARLDRLLEGEATAPRNSSDR